MIKSKIDENLGKSSLKRPKALVLLSGGLDSLLAARIILDHNVDVEAVHFVTPFCRCDCGSLGDFINKFNIKLHTIFLGQEYLDVVANPKHGYGSQMNPCLDCRILMFRKAWELAKKIDADFLVTGEVLDERPFSQRLKNMLLIEREAGLEGKILRPLSAKLLPISEPEKRGWVDRKKLFAIRGRKRLPQMELAKKFGIENYPTPSGGCLLTDPAFARRVREHLKHEGRLTIDDAILLMIGRHFRVNGAKIIVGRNEGENNRLLAIAERRKIPNLKVKEYMGPITLLIGGNCNNVDKVVKIAAAITVRYSDAPKNILVKVIYRCGEREIEITAKAINDEEIEKLRV